jgi:hypothetical protein
VLAGHVRKLAVQGRQAFGFVEHGDYGGEHGRAGRWTCEPCRCGMFRIIQRTDCASGKVRLLHP